MVIRRLEAVARVFFAFLAKILIYPPRLIEHDLLKPARSQMNRDGELIFLRIVFWKFTVQKTAQFEVQLERKWIHRPIKAHVKFRQGVDRRSVVCGGDRN